MTTLQSMCHDSCLTVEATDNQSGKGTHSACAQLEMEVGFECIWLAKLWFLYYTRLFQDPWSDSWCLKANTLVQWLLSWVKCLGLGASPGPVCASISSSLKEELYAEWPLGYLLGYYHSWPFHDGCKSPKDLYKGGLIAQCYFEWLMGFFFSEHCVIFAYTDAHLLLLSPLTQPLSIFL
jgi:hypothetical protein